MNKRKYVIIILLCMAAWLQAQDSVKAFDEFFVTGMKKIEGVFPVYVAEKEVYLEIPREYIGREIEVRGQIDRGFDLLNRPVTGLGVVRIMSPDKATICFQKPFYTERILDEKSVYQRSFSLSNIQPAGDSYPVVAYSKEQGAIIRITKYLINGNDWFSYNHGFIRSLVPELSELTKIHPFEEGVSFTVRRYHGVEAERYMFSSSAIILPEGSIPLEVTCVVRLLPQKKDQIRLADHRIPYQTLTFKDYSQDPYCRRFINSSLGYVETAYFLCRYAFSEGIFSSCERRNIGMEYCIPQGRYPGCFTSEVCRQQDCSGRTACFRFL